MKCHTVVKFVGSLPFSLSVTKFIRVVPLCLSNSITEILTTSPDTTMSYFTDFPELYISTCDRSSCGSQHVNWERYIIKITYLLTPWSRVLPEKLKRPKLLKKFPAFYRTRRFITAFTRARHLSLSWARLIQYMPPSNLSQVHFNIILPSTSGSSKWMIKII
jgi:hypothetical protein